MIPADSKNHFVLQCRGLKKYFQIGSRQIQVLQEVNLDVEKGKIVLIRGRSGTGKSTLLSLLAGLDRPTGGSIRLEDLPLENLGSADLARLRRRKIGIDFQNFNLLPAWTAFRNVEAALLHDKLSPKIRRQKVLALMEKFGLTDRLENLPSELSVGEQQRIAVARALINDPALILADEPTGDVDPETADEILRTLTDAVRGGERTLLVTTHGSFSASAAHQLLRLENGRLSA